MRVLFVSHGFPPRECAGTENHVYDLALQAQAAGHTVAVIAATRRAGALQGSVEDSVVEGIPITRVTNNLTTRPLSWAERDAAIEAVVQPRIDRFGADVVHIHHLQFLSSGLRFRAPHVVTLHDQWHWCAAGGQGLEHPHQAPCPGPTPERCAPCAAAWRPTPGTTARLLSRVAQTLAPVVGTERLHRAWKRVPSLLRPRPERGVASPCSPGDAAARNAAMIDVLRSAVSVISPSRWLADRCAQVTGVVPTVIRHGVPADFLETPRPPGPRDTVLFLGTIAAHKGPDRVVRAWRQACPDGSPPLRIHGAISDARLLLGHPAGPLLDRAGVRAALDRARVLVLGSTWPENAPLIITEARARGCPVVAPAVGGIPELIEDHRDGLVVPTASPDHLAAGLRTVLDTPMIPRPPPSSTQQAARILAHLQRAGVRR